MGSLFSRPDNSPSIDPVEQEALAAVADAKMEAIALAHPNAILPGYEEEELRAGVYCLTIPESNLARVGDGNIDYRRFGAALAGHALLNGKSVVVVSPEDLGYYLGDECNGSIRVEDVAEFKEDGRNYNVSVVPRDQLAQILPELCQCAEFVNGDDVWLSLFREETSARELCENEAFVKDMVNAISGLDVSIELIYSDSYKSEVYWLNPERTLAI